MADIVENEKKQADFSEAIHLKAIRKLKAQESIQGIWFGLGMMGLVGWSIVIPTLGGSALGLWLDGRYPRSYSWTLTLLLLGLVVGCLNAWHWVAQEHREMQEDGGNIND
jgi:ATP synthase protein I